MASNSAFGDGGHGLRRNGVFRAKRADRVKILVWDGSGMVLIAKRLEQGKFAWPPVSGGVMRLSSAQFAALFEGLDWRRVHARRTPRPTIAGQAATR